MATTRGSRRGNFVGFDEYVELQLQKTRDGIRTTDVLTAVVLAVCLVIGYLVLFVLVDHCLGADFLSSGVRLGLGLGIVAIAAGWIAWQASLPLRRRVSTLFAARAIEDTDPGLEGNLLNLVDLRRADRPVASGVLNSIEKRAAVGLSRADLDGAVDRLTLMRATYVLLGLVVVCCLYTLLGPKRIGPSLARAFGAGSSVPTETIFEEVLVHTGVDGGNRVPAIDDPQIPAGYQPRITVTLDGVIPDRVTLFYTTADRRYVDQPRELERAEDALGGHQTREFTVKLIGENGRGLMQDLDYFLVAGDATSDRFHIRVNEVTTTTVASVLFEYPAYMRLQNELRTDQGGDIEAWEGTIVTVVARASRPVDTARIVFTNTEDTSQKAEEFSMTVDEGGRRLVARWTLEFRDGDHENYARFYRIVCDSQDGSNLRPALYRIDIRPDPDPVVELLDPTADLEMPANGIVPLLVRARDPEFGLKYLTLRISKDGERLDHPRQEIFEGEQRSFGPLSFNFALEPLRLMPGDIISYLIEARDNKLPLGNRTRTAERRITIIEPVSPEEVQQQLDQAKQEQQDKLEEARNQDNEQADQHPPREPGDEPEPQNDQADDPAGEQTKPEEPPPDDQPQGDDKSQSDTPGGRDNKPSSSPSDRQGDQAPTDGDKADNEDAGNKTKPGEPGDDGQADDESKRPLSNDGDDDDEAIRRILDKQREQDADKQKPGDDPAEPSDDPDKPGDQKSKTDDPKSKTDDKPGDPKSKTADKPGDPKSKTDDKPGDPKSKTDDKPGDPKSKTDDKPGDPKSKTDDKPGDPKSKTDDKPGDPKSKTDDKPGDPKSKTDDKPDKPGDPKSQSDGQPSDKPSDGESKRGKPGGKSKPGQATGKPGDQPSKPGDPSGKSARQSKPDPSGGKPGNADGKPGSKPGDNKPPQPATDRKNKGARKNAEPGDMKKKNANRKKSEGKPSEGSGGKPAEPGGKTGDDPGKSSGDNPGEGSSKNPAATGSGSTGSKRRGTDGPRGNGDDGEPREGSGPNQAPDLPNADAPNKEFTREAANLVLKRIEDELERGQVDPELLRELGWTEDDMRRFAERLGDQVRDTGADKSPEAEAQRRQFEELLRSVPVESRGTRRQGQAKRNRRTDGLNAADQPVPLEFREAVKLYRRNLTRRRTRQPVRPAPRPKR